MDVKLTIGGISPAAQKWFRGLLWMVSCSLAPIAWEVWSDLTDYKGTPLDWKHIGLLALSAMGTAVIAYWRATRSEALALVAIPPDVQAELEGLRQQIYGSPAAPATFRHQ